MKKVSNIFLKNYHFKNYFRWIKLLWQTSTNEFQDIIE